MEAQVIELEQRIISLDHDNTSPITKQAACATIRDVIVPMLNAEIKATGFFGFLARAALSKVRAILESYLQRNCPAGA